MKYSNRKPHDLGWGGWILECEAQQAGFSLIEGLVVLMVMGILSAIAAPTWLSFMNIRQLNAAQAETIQVMRLAQTNAKRYGNIWEANFREVNQQVQVSVHAATTPPSAASWDMLNSNALIDPNETTLSRSNQVYRIQFGPRGQINGQLGRLTFVGKNGGNARRCVILSTLLGAMRRGSDQPIPDQTGRSCY